MSVVLRNRIVIVICLIVIVYILMKSFNIFKKRKATNFAKSAATQRKNEAKKLKRKKAYLALLSNLGKKMLKDKYQEDAYTVFLERKPIQLKYFNGVKFDAKQYKGFVLIIGVFFISFGILVSLLLRMWKLGLIIVAMGVGLLFTDKQIFDLIIADENKYIEKYFSQFYFIIYSEIYYKTGTRIKASIKLYSKSLEIIGNKADKPLCNMADNYLRFLESYDNKIATKKMMELYKFPLFLNFATLVVQRLEGRDNRVKLDKLKEELVNESIRNIEKNKKKRIAAGERLQFLLYIILFQIVILGLLANTGIFNTLIK